jgi:hypothetical protein
MANAKWQMKTEWQMPNGKWQMANCADSGVGGTVVKPVTAPRSAPEHLPFGICHLPFAICHLPFAICHLPFAICH